MRRFVGRGLRRALAGLGMVGALLLMGSAPTPQAPPSEGVQVPVVLDGVRYEPEEFNRIHRELQAKGVFLIFMIDPQTGDFLAFSGEESCNEFAAKRGLRPCIGNPPPDASVGSVVRKGNITYVHPPDGSSFHSSTWEDSKAQPSQVCPPFDLYWSKNWEHINCAGDSLWVAPNVAISDLRNVGGQNWNDRISSAQAAAGIYREILYEHINYSGDKLYVWAGWLYPDLRELGWNDRASSLWTEP